MRDIANLRRLPFRVGGIFTLWGQSGNVRNNGLTDCWFRGSLFHMPEELILPAEACALLGVTDQTLRRWVDDGSLPAIRTVGGHRRYRRSDVMDLIVTVIPEVDA